MFPDDYKAIPVTCVSDEYAHIAAHPCPACGGRWKVRMQALLKDAQGGHYDRIHVICCQCATRNVFHFDVSSVVQSSRAEG